MKLNSKYFDSIRVKPDKDRRQRDHNPACEWPNCGKPGGHPAPKGRGREGEYFSFCIEHVREYNKNYNFFKGMSDEDIVKFQEAITTGHRPTWRMGTNGQQPKSPFFDAHQWGLNGARAQRKQGTSRNRSQGSYSMEDPFTLFGAGAAQPDAGQFTPRKPLRPMERKCLRALNLDDTADRDDIKARFKELVKRHHPDSSGGQGSEDKLRDVIQAYNYLRRCGRC